MATVDISVAAPDTSTSLQSDDGTDSGKVKGILKNKQPSHDNPEVKWDEMNILETYHPVNKDYGHMKIDEPPTPYNHEFAEDVVVEDLENTSLDADKVATKLTASKPRADYDSGRSADEDDDKHLSDKALTKKKLFRNHRAQHYDEFSKVKMARDLIAKELAEIEDNENGEMDTSK